MKYCGTCRHAMPTKELQQRVCMLHPPQLVTVLQGNQAGIASMRPMVTVHEPACGQYSVGIYGVEDLVIDHDVTK